MNMAQFFLTTIIFICSLLHSVAFPSSTVGAVERDILFPDQELVVGQTLVSRNQVFEMGFFSPGKSSNRFMGIWYKSTPDVVFWVGNRNDPISASQEPVFMASRHGSLVITSGKSIIWSVNSSMVASNPVLQLLDSGNLVLVDNNSTYIWQSFHYPTDTMLPGMKMVDDAEAGVERCLTSWRNPNDPSPGDFVIKIQNHGLPEIVILRQATTRYRVGQWNGEYFWGGVKFPNSMFKPEIVFREERLISIGEPYGQPILKRITIDSSGAVVHHHMNAQKDKWNVASKFPRDSCDEYASCGPNSMCRSDRMTRCQCLKGFAPKFQKDWDLQDLSGGCARITPLNCHGGDGFLQIRGVKYPDLLSFRINSSINLEECRNECLKNCSCTAYANLFITNGGSGCLLWFAELMDTKALSDADSKRTIYIRLPLSELGKSFHNWLFLWQAWLLWQEEKILELMDECLNNTFMESEVKRCMQVGLLCVQKFAEDRPTMSSVVSMLGSDGAFLPEPKEPGFFNERSGSSSFEQSRTLPSFKSDNEIIITDLEAR